MIAIDSTQESSIDRSNIYINGVKQSELSTDTRSSLDAKFQHNEIGEGHYIGNSANQAADFQGIMSDVFMVDGLALTPDVFGYHKEGDGYVSAGTTTSVKFKRGQWIPKSPKVIKSAINAKGGFGPNGYYLPMNDSSNFGADFHCAPNSIIKLKGEDLPQPRNGAPEMTDAYVSQLREDPYATNLVLAVPGISTATGPNLITNGNFDSNVSGWTAVDATLTWSNGKAQTNRTGGAGYTAYQAITGLVSGQRYTLSGTIDSTGTGNRQDLRVLDNLASSGGSIIVNVSGTNNQVVQNSGSFTATGTTHYVYLVSDNSGTGFFDNIVVKQEDAPRDYSADIKGSGTNKTPTLSGSSGVGYELGGYYGSAYTSSSNNDYLEFPGTSGDFNVGTGDFTIEMWLNPDSTQTTNARIFGQDGNSAGNWDVYIELTSASNQIKMMGGGTALTGGNGSSYGNLVGNQWNHFCLERYDGQLTTYVNGVAVYTQSYTSSIGDNNTFRIGQIGSNVYGGDGYGFNGEIQDFRFYKGVAKYKGGFDVPKPYTPVGIESWRAVPDTTANNFATLNPLDAVTNNLSGTDYTQATHSNGNLTVILSDNFSSARGSIGVSSGKYYWEIRIDNNTNSPGMGVVAPGNQLTSYSPGGGGASYEPRGDRFRKNGVGHYDGTDNKTDDGLIVGVALDKDAGSISFYANGELLSNGTMTGLNDLSDVHIPECFTFNDGPNIDNTFTWNFGQNPSFSGQTTAGTYTDSSGKGLFKYQPPAGYLALCEDNLPTPAIADPGEHFKTVLWTGVNGTNKIKCGFQPDFVWIKNRDYVNWHSLYDSIRGPYLELNSNQTSANRDRSSNDGLRSFDSDGFTSGLDDNTGGRPGDSYVAWCWKAGGAAVSNNNGTITSQVSANQDAGFSIVSTNGSGTAGHGLNATPQFIISKRTTLISDWSIQHHKMMTSSTGKLLFSSAGVVTSSTPYMFNANDTTFEPVYTDPCISYCWTEIEGYSKFGSYVGNGNANANGPFVYCGFKPAFVLCKITTTTGNWVLKSNHISTNPNDFTILPDLPDTEYGPANTEFDFLSNGFKIRTSSVLVNTSGATIVFAAFAESPFSTANAK